MIKYYLKIIGLVSIVIEIECFSINYPSDMTYNLTLPVNGDTESLERGQYIVWMICELLPSYFAQLVWENSHLWIETCEFFTDPQVCF